MSGFLPFSRASFMLDFVFVAMALILPALAYSIYVVKHKRNYALHKKLQLGIAIALGVAVLLFEIDMRLFGWRQYAEASPYYNSLVFPVLTVHLVAAISTTLGWIITVYQALKHFSSPPKPGAHSAFHKSWAKWSAYGMYLTGFTGWVFFYLAFIA